MNYLKSVEIYAIKEKLSVLSEIPIIISKIQSKIAQNIRINYFK